MYFGRRPQGNGNLFADGELDHTTAKLNVVKHPLATKLRDSETPQPSRLRPSRGPSAIV